MPQGRPCAHGISIAASNAIVSPLMRILGIDPGSRFLGVGCIDQRPGRVAYVGHELVAPRGETLAERLAFIDQALANVLARLAPEQVAVETVFYGKNARSAFVLAHARGVALACSARAGLPVFEYAPATIKRAVGVSGRAGKAQVARMLGILLNHPELERSDCSDALACALAHGQRIHLHAPKARQYTIVRRS